MNAEQLEREFRRPTRADDSAKPYLHSQEDVFRWATEAEREACIRARLIYDETTREVCRIPVAPGRVRYNLDPRIIEVTDIWVDKPATGTVTTSHRLHAVDQSNARRRHPRFFEHGNIAAPGSDYGNDYCGGNGALRLGNHLGEYSVDGRTLSLYTIPDTSFTTTPAVLRVCGYRLPLRPIKGPKDCFEIPELQQDGLIHWLLWRAGGGQDDESGTAKANAALSEFTARYGPRPSANVLRQQAENRSDCITYGGY